LTLTPFLAVEVPTQGARIIARAFEILFFVA
jgi:hypothetical protein